MNIRKNMTILIMAMLVFSMSACSRSSKEAGKDSSEVSAAQAGETSSEAGAAQAGENSGEAENIKTSESSDKEEGSGTDNGTLLTDNGIKTLVDSTDLQMSPYLVCARNSKNDLFGYIDVRTGEYVIEPQFKYCDESFGDDGWAIVNYEGNRNVINTEGEFLFSHEDIGGVSEYEGDCIVVCTPDGQKALLYHGAHFVCELEIPVKEYTTVSSGVTYYSTGYASVPYTPERYIIMSVEANNEWQRVWYDSDGKVIFVTKEIGGLAGDDTGYYFIRENFIDVIDFDGNIVETIEKDHSEAYGDYIGIVEWDNDNWYAIISLNGETGLYTNGLSKLCEAAGYTRDYWDNIDADCGVIRLLDGSCIKPDGTLFFEGLSYRMGSYAGAFRNGYAKTKSNGNTAYMDTQGNPVFEIPKERWKEYSEVLKDGYIVYGENGLWGIMNIDGSIVIEPKFQSIYTME